MKRGARVLVAATLVLLSACSLIVDLDGLAGSAASDAALDASAEAEAEAGPFCANEPPKRVFCSDFDEQPYLAGWTPDVPDGALGGVENGSSTSPPNSFWSVSQATDASVYPPARHLDCAVPLSPSRTFTVGFSFYVDAVDPTTLSGFVIVGFEQTGFFWELELSTQQSILHELTQNNSVDHSFPVDLTKLYQGWHRFELHFDASDGGSGVVTLTADGQSLFPNAASEPSQAGALFGSTLGVQIGIFPGAGPESIVSAHYDDFFVDVP